MRCILSLLMIVILVGCQDSMVRRKDVAVRSNASIQQSAAIVNAVEVGSVKCVGSCGFMGCQCPMKAEEFSVVLGDFLKNAGYLAASGAGILKVDVEMQDIRTDSSKEFSMKQLFIKRDVGQKLPIRYIVTDKRTGDIIFNNVILSESNGAFFPLLTPGVPGYEVARMQSVAVGENLAQFINVLSMAK